MILLVGPENWANRMRRELSDRTTHRKSVALNEEDMRGTNSWVEIVQYVDPRLQWEPSHSQKRAIMLAEVLNRAWLTRQFLLLQGSGEVE